MTATASGLPTTIPTTREAWISARAPARPCWRSPSSGYRNCSSCSTQMPAGSVLAVFQAMDGGGKDGTIKRVMSGVNPQGVAVHSFKQPGPVELGHDFLWRIHQALPLRGQIGIFNRSHYEEVLVTPAAPGGDRQAAHPRGAARRRTLLEAPLPGYQGVRTLSRAAGRRGAEVLPEHLEGGTAPAAAGTPRRSRQELEVLRKPT